MKKIEDIETMTPEELELAAEKLSASVPEGLQSRIETVLAAKAICDDDKPKAPKRAPGWIAATGLAAAAAIAAFAIFPIRASSEPKDTFDDPALAYAQVEATFRQISDKMASVANKPIEVTNNKDEQ